MQQILYILFTIIVATNILNAAPARGGVVTFTQADGSEFSGELKGDSAFHWIESEGEVILYDANRKAYYTTEVTPEGKLAPSNRKPSSTSHARSSVQDTQKKIDSNTYKALKAMRQEASSRAHSR